MPTLYRSILITQPADGDIVFVRRFTRDPPVLAAWDLTNQQFTLAVTAALTIIGGTYAGTYAASFIPFVPGPNGAGWGLYVAGIFLGALEFPPGTWQLATTDLVANAWQSNPYAAPPFPHTETTFNQIGTPTFTTPTSMQLAAPTSAALILPAYIVSAWRPQ